MNTRQDFLKIMYEQDPLHEPTQTAGRLDESMYAAMYGQQPIATRALPQIPGLLPGQKLSMHTLLEMILRLQGQVADQDRILRKLSQQMSSTMRQNRSAERDIENLHHELDRKVTRRD